MTENGKENPICFVVMPIADMNGYEPGHFGRVYEHLIKPAVIAAGYTPVRADDTNKTDYIVVGIIKRIVESPMVICDYSARNANVMYELGIRHAFNLPVVLIKDKCTDKIFDIQGPRYAEYDESLRIDSVQKDTARITKTIQDTASSDNDDYNSVVRLAGLTAAKVPEAQQVSADTQLIMSAIASLERRIDNQERAESPISSLKYHPDHIVLKDEDAVSVGDHIYDKETLAPIGVVISVSHPSRKILVKTKEGRQVIDTTKRAITKLPF